MGPGAPPPHQSPCKALKPWRGTRVEPVTNCSSLALLSSSKVSTACQNHLTTLLSATQCFSRVLDFQSLTSILSRPPMISCEGIWRQVISQMHTPGHGGPPRFPVYARREFVASQETSQRLRCVERETGPRSQQCIFLQPGLRFMVLRLIGEESARKTQPARLDGLPGRLTGGPRGLSQHSWTRSGVRVSVQGGRPAPSCSPPTLTGRRLAEAKQQGFQSPEPLGTGVGKR